MVSFFMSPVVRMLESDQNVFLPISHYSCTRRSWGYKFTSKTHTRTPAAGATISRHNRFGRSLGLAKNPLKIEVT